MTDQYTDAAGRRSTVTRDWDIVVEPRYEPVSLADAKVHARVEVTDDDALIALLIKAARERAEDITGRSFITRTVEMILDQFPQGAEPLTLLRSPVQYLVAIEYEDSAGDTQVLDVDDFVVSTAGRNPSRMVPAGSGSWPAVAGTPGCVRIQYVAGYAPQDSPDDEAAHQAVMPGALVAWMLLRVTTLYDNRDSIVMGTLAEFPRDYVDGLLDGLILQNGLA